MTAAFIGSSWRTATARSRRQTEKGHSSNGTSPKSLPTTNPTKSLSGGADAVPASVTVEFSGANNDLLFTVKASAFVGEAGNNIKLAFVNRGDDPSDSASWDPASKTVTFRIASNTVAQDL